VTVRDVLVLDYGKGNLHSVGKALERVGARVALSGRRRDVEAARCVVLPGVGAFGDAMAALRDLGLVEAILAHVRAGKQFLGVCLGLQVLFERGLEFGDHVGLGLLPGLVRAFDTASVAGLKVPHMGWAATSVVSDCALFDGIPDGTHFYYVHSFVADARPDDVVATAVHGERFTAAVRLGERAFATQFHPEKSQSAGLRLLENFVWLDA